MVRRIKKDLRKSPYTTKPHTINIFGDANKSFPKTKTFEVKESGFVANFITARSGKEAAKKQQMRKGTYGGSLRVTLSEYDMVKKRKKQ